MGEQLSKIYKPKKIEQQANELWSSNSYFHPNLPSDDKDRKAYTIVIPPPNVTAPLHLGHALNNTLQDVLIRFRRMQNYNTLWMPGTDHAGIATQTVVEKRILSEEGKRRTDLERQEFVERVQAWKDEYEACIISQLKAMGCSCDWQRTRFTMDDVCAKAVRAVFFKLFKVKFVFDHHDICPENYVAKFGRKDFFYKIFLITIVCQICLYFYDLYDLKVTDNLFELTIRLLQASADSLRIYTQKI